MQLHYTLLISFYKVVILHLIFQKVLSTIYNKGFKFQRKTSSNTLAITNNNTALPRDSGQKVDKVPQSSTDHLYQSPATAERCQTTPACTDALSQHCTSCNIQLASSHSSLLTQQHP